MNLTDDQKEVVEYVRDLLDDDHGLSETAYSGLFSLMMSKLPEAVVTKITNLVDATDGRFYIQTGALDDLLT